jgi:mono/diheme cytochrome c family protein
MGVVHLCALHVLRLYAFGAPIQAGAATDAVRIAQDTHATVATYTNCSACHGSVGEGHFGPALKGDSELVHTAYVVGMILNGSSHMPSFKAQLNDTEIAIVATYIRTHWGNHWGTVTAGNVAQLRRLHSARAKTPPAR